MEHKIYLPDGTYYKSKKQEETNKFIMTLFVAVESLLWLTTVAFCGYRIIAEIIHYHFSLAYILGNWEYRIQIGTVTILLLMLILMIVREKKLPLLYIMTAQKNRISKTIVLMLTSFLLALLWVNFSFKALIPTLLAIFSKMVYFFSKSLQH
jgi:hypothetical protein